MSPRAFPPRLWGDTLNAIPLPVLTILTVLLMLGAVEAGYWLGKWRLRRDHENDVTTANAIIGTTLGLLAFTLAFTFAMAASRYDTRRELVVEEANAIGTAYLRALMLPPPQASETRDLLRQYVDARLVAATRGKQAEGIAASERLHGLLWRQTVAAGSARGDSVMVGLFIASLNDVIDLHAKRLAAWRNHIPGTIWLFLHLTAVFGMASIGYHAGLSGSRRTLAVVFVALAFACAMTLVADLDRPREGFVRVSQQSMLDLQTSMKADAQGSP